MMCIVHFNHLFLMFLCRPKKPYVLHYQNGTAYTYLGLKCSTRVFYCSIHKVRKDL
jgi:hypothetical protein